MGRAIEYFDTDPEWLARAEADPSCLTPEDVRAWVTTSRSLSYCHVFRPELGSRLTVLALNWLGVVDPEGEIAKHNAGAADTGYVVAILRKEAAKVEEAVERFKTLIGALAHAAERLPDVPARVE